VAPRGSGNGRGSSAALWTCAEAAEACDISSRRYRAIVAALYDGGVLDCEREAELVGNLGQAPAQWSLSAAGRALEIAPVMVVDGRTGLITGVRAGGAAE
jgi:hypothetical protein